MDNQLKNISTQYRKFTKGQYVKSSQFNEFLDFFEDQDRLSRVLLQGVGIVCGLESKPVYRSGQLSSIQLSQGVAVTTDGDLLTLNKTSEASKELYVSDLKTIQIEIEDYTHFKVYDNSKLKYPAFIVGSTDQIDLWELVTDKEADSDLQPVERLPDVEDKYMLLYLESDEKEIRPCRGVDCDNHGVQQIRNLKVLVTTAEGIDRILTRDQVQPHPLFIKDIMQDAKQERVIVERLISERGAETHFLSSDLKGLYQAVLEKSGYGQSVFQKINAIAEVMGVPAADHQNFKALIGNCLTQMTGFQYAYDVVKDLDETYSEIIKLLPKAFTECLPDSVSFPKHVMLGKLVSEKHLDSSRHQFYNSPVLDDEKTAQRVKLLLSRFKQQAQNFRYSDRFESEAKIKITPSQKLNPLSRKAIPFYYKVTEDFLKAWDFDTTGNRSFRDILGYDVSLLSSEEHIQEPVYFNIDKNSFYNIEGHQGMDYQEAFRQMRKMRDEQQLGFDIMVVSLGELTDNKDMFKAYFNEYVEKHPGLEHKRGVERGGTFVMVYEINGREAKVFADFSLPYICCTPKIDVKLSLPDPVICSEAAPVPFTVFPMNGEVKADVDGRLNGGVKIAEGKYFFDPKMVSPELHNHDISFTVNGKPVSCSIRVIPQSSVEVAVSSVDFKGGDSTLTTVNFKISGAGFKDYAYTWDFWDNGHWVHLNPDSEGKVSYVFRDLNPKIIPVIRVNADLNGCTQNIIIEDWYDAPDAPTLVIDRIGFSAENCCENIVPVVKAEIEGPKDLPLSDRQFVLAGKGYGPATLIYSWTKIKGPAVTLAGANKPDLQITNLAVGDFVFQLTVLHAESGVFAKAETAVSIYSDK